MDARVQRFVERFGRYFEASGASYSAGQILAWLLVSEEPQSLDDFARGLQISKASASLGTRLWEQFGFIERTHVRGDRKVYYQLRPNLAQVFAQASVAKFKAMVDLLDEGREAVGPERANALAVLEELARIYRHLTLRIPQVLAELEEE